MVCVYCSNDTRVTNSRLQKRQNQIWRRRQCLSCGAVFSTTEAVTYGNALAVQNGTSHITPFSRDLLFLSIYESCRHRTQAAADAAALTDTVIAKLHRLQESPGSLDRDTIVLAASETLKAFDAVACVHYLAFHPLARS